MKFLLDAFQFHRLPVAARPDFARVVVPRLARACHDAGVRPMVSTDLTDFWRICKGDPGRAVASQFVDPALDPEHGPADTAFIVLWRDGLPVASAGARLRWVPGTLAEAIVDGSLLYPRGTPKGWRAECVASQARAIAGTWVAVYTGYWRARSEDPRDPVPMHLAVRLLHAITLGAWGYSHAVAFCEDGVARSAAHAVWLAEFHQPGVAWDIQGEAYRLNLVVTGRDALITKMLDPRAVDPTALLHLPAAQRAPASIPERRSDHGANEAR